MQEQAESLRRPGIHAVVLLAFGLLGNACEDPGSSPRPPVVTDPGPATSSGAAMRSAEQLEDRIGEYQQRLIDQMDDQRNGPPGTTFDPPSR